MNAPLTAGIDAATARDDNVTISLEGESEDALIDDASAHWEQDGSSIVASRKDSDVQYGIESTHAGDHSDASPGSSCFLDGSGCSVDEPPRHTSHTFETECDDFPESVSCHATPAGGRPARDE